MSGTDYPNWKQHPGLFCNGKFQIMGMRGAGDFVMWSATSDMITYQTKTHSYPHDVHLDNARLIARKIEDMSHEQVNQVNASTLDPAQCENLKYNWIKYFPEWNQFLRMLSIGVYPFDQSHFDTGEVIDIKTL